MTPTPRIDASAYLSKPVSKTLSAEEKADLVIHEQTISGGLKTFVEVGVALAEISDHRLYRETHSAFHDYCIDKWRISAKRAYQLCEAAEVVTQVVAASTDRQPRLTITNERQARELAKVEPSKRAQVLAVASKSGPPTAKAIKAVARQLTGAASPEDGAVSPTAAPSQSPAVAQPGSARVATPEKSGTDSEVAGSNPAALATPSLKSIKLAVREVLLALDRPPVDFESLAGRLDAIATDLRSTHRNGVSK